MSNSAFSQNAPASSFADLTGVPDDNAALAAALAGKADAIPQYKFTGDGGATTGTVAKNTYPTAFTVTNPGAGQYRFAAVSGTPFTTGKTFVSIMAIDGSTVLAWKVFGLSDAQVEISFCDTVSQVGVDPNPGYTICIETEP